MRWPFALLIASACGRVGFDGAPDVARDAAPRNTVVQLSIGAFTSRARLASGALWCWGDGMGGTLGDGDEFRAAPGAIADGVIGPVQVLGLP